MGTYHRPHPAAYEYLQAAHHRHHRKCRIVIGSNAVGEAQNKENRLTCWRKSSGIMGGTWGCSTSIISNMKGDFKMNNAETITINTEEYAELIMCRTRLNILSTYVEHSDKCYLDDNFIALILGVTRKAVE